MSEIHLLPLFCIELDDRIGNTDVCTVNMKLQTAADWLITTQFGITGGYSMCRTVSQLKKYSFK